MLPICNKTQLPFLRLHQKKNQEELLEKQKHITRKTMNLPHSHHARSSPLLFPLSLFVLLPLLLTPSLTLLLALFLSLSLSHTQPFFLTHTSHSRASGARENSPGQPSCWFGSCLPV